MSYDNPASPGHGGSPGRGAAGARSEDLDDGHARRGRSPADDDRRKRRRSPSPGNSRNNDGYYGNHPRERSPYRGGSGGAYYGAPPAYGGAVGGPAGYDRYDSRGGYRDPYDPYAMAPPAYDRRAPQSSSASQRPRMQAPTELPYLVTFAYYRDWMKDEDHRIYDDRAKLDEAYKKYRIGFLHKNNRAFWDEIKGFPWTTERYGSGEDEVAERKRLRALGREGKLEAYLALLQSGDIDDLSYDQKAPASPPKRELKLENGDDSGKDAAKTEDNSEVKAEANGDENIQTDEAGNKLEASDEAQVKIEGAAEGEPAKAAKADEEAQPAQEDDAKKTEDDQVLIPAAPTTLFIKSVSPEISRADLEKHCSQVDGLHYIALSEPNPSKRFHRYAWVVYRPDVDMKEAVEKLSESKVNDFTLHMTLQDKPSYQRLRSAPSLMNAPDRIKASLEHVRTLVTKHETEISDDRGSKALEAKLVQLRDKSDYDAPDGEDDHARAIRIDILERRFLDLYIHYLRTVFHVCYYCVASTDFAEELVRKCVGHVRKQQPHTNKNSKSNEQNWVKNFDEKIPLLTDRESVDPIEHGGENYQEELSKLAKPNIQIEDEGKYRCKACKKLFKAGPFVEKHILNKHPELIAEKLQDVTFFNTWVLDPSKVPPPVADAPVYSTSANYPANNGTYYPNNNRMADTFGAFNQMFNPQFNGYMMGAYGGFYNPMYAPPPMSAGFNGFGAAGYGAPMSGDARALGGRIGDRAMDPYSMGGTPTSMRSNGGGSASKRPRRESNPAPPPPPKGAKIDPRAGKLHAYTDLDGPPAGGGEDMALDY